MNKPLSIVLLFFFCTGQLFSQKKEFKSQLYIGIGGGALISSVDFVPAVLQKSRYGIVGGVSAKYISEKSLGLLLELNYAQRGWKEDFPSESGFAYNRTLNYLEIPMMTHVYFGKKFRFIFNAGPQIGFLIGNSDKMSYALAADVDKKRREKPDARIGIQYVSELQKFDYGLIGGTGMEFQTGIGNFALEGRYYFGLGDIFQSRKTTGSVTSDPKGNFSRSAHRIIEAKLTYYINIKPQKQ